jgi:sulfate permease, SulP family
VPVSQDLPGYRGGTLRRDLLAGVTVAALALPSAMAYAELAGLSPVAGLYALLLPTVAYTLLGSSRQLIVGPEGSVAALVATALVPLAAGDPQRYASLAALLALLVGGVFLAARVVRLGWIADYFSRAVLIGYIHGVAVVLVVGQLGKLLGLDIDAQDPLPQLFEVARELPGLSGATLAVGAVCLALLLVLRWQVPKLPGPLLVVVLAVAASWALGLADRGVAVVSEIPPGLPGLELPVPHLGDTLRLLPAALGIFFVSFSDEILTARSFAGRHGQHVPAEQELAAMGAANLAAAITQSFPIGASGSRTAVNDQMGGRTQLSGLIGAAAIAVVLLVFTAPMRYLPKATLGAVIVAAAVGLVDLAAWRGLARISRVEVAIAAITMAGVVLVGVLEALIVAVALSVVDVVRRSATPHDAVLGWVPRLGRYADVRLHPSARLTPGVLVYRLDDRLFFANAGYVTGRIREAIEGAPTPVRWLVFDAEALSHVDATGIDALTQLHESLRKERITLLVARLKGPIRQALRDAGVLQLIGEGHVYPRCGPPCRPHPPGPPEDPLRPVHGDRRIVHQRRPPVTFPVADFWPGCLDGPGRGGQHTQWSVRKSPRRGEATPPEPCNAIADPAGRLSEQPH